MDSIAKVRATKNAYAGILQMENDSVVYELRYRPNINKWDTVAMRFKRKFK